MSCAACRRPWVVFSLTAKLSNEGAAEEFQLWRRNEAFMAKDEPSKAIAVA